MLDPKPKEKKCRRKDRHKISDIAHRNILLHISPQAMETKDKINKWDFIKLKSFCIAKEIINKIKRQPQNARTYLLIHLLSG